MSKVPETARQLTIGHHVWHSRYLRQPKVSNETSCLVSKVPRLAKQLAIRCHIEHLRYLEQPKVQQQDIEFDSRFAIVSSGTIGSQQRTQGMFPLATALD